MNNFFRWMSGNTVFVILAGLASIISLIISFMNEKWFFWAILSIASLTLILLQFLIYQNELIVRRLDVLYLKVFETSVDLEFNENGNYYSQADVIIAVQSSLTSNTLNAQPKASLYIQYPSQIKIQFSWRDPLIRKEETIDSCKITFPLSNGITFIALRKIHLDQMEEGYFQRSSKKIAIKLDCESLNEARSELINLSTVG